MTDPIASMLIMLKNAGSAGKPSIVVPFSNIKLAIAEFLSKEGYAGAVAKKMKKSMPVIEIAVVYKDERPKVTQVERVSKPSRRMYMGSADLRKVKNGFGMLVLSTPKGIMGGEQARKEHVGGEALFKIW